MQSKYIIMFFVLCFSCTIKNMEYHLNTGLNEYLISRNIYEGFTDNFIVEKVAFFKNNDTLQKIVLRLDKNTSKDTVANYSLGLHAYVKEKYLTNSERNFLIWDSKPEIINFNEYSYIIKNVNTPVKEMDSLLFFLYDRDRYEGVIGNRILIKNIGLK